MTCFAAARAIRAGAPAGSARWGLLVTALLGASSVRCGGVEPQARVRVVVQGIDATRAATVLRGERSATVWAFFRAADGTNLGGYAMGIDSGGPSPSDAGRDEWESSWDRARELRRAAYWPRREPFDLEVELPALRFSSVRVLVAGTLSCRTSTGATELRPVVLADGFVNAELAPRADRVIELALSVHERALECVGL